MKELPPGKHLLGAGIQVFLDLSLLLAAFVAAYLLRFDFRIPPDDSRRPCINLALYGPRPR